MIQNSLQDRQDIQRDNDDNKGSNTFRNGTEECVDFVS